jgi:apolipoprotein N-acyltransferase
MWVWSLNKKSKILIPLSFIATFYLIGFLEFKKVEAGQEVDVTVVQPNFLFKDPLKEKMNHEDYLIHKTESFINLVIEAKNKYPDNKILVFPETSYPIYFYSPESFAHEELNNQLKNLVETLDIELFFGGFKRENGLNSNVYIHLYKKDELVLDSFYTKTRLFPFGEEVPFSDVFPFLNKIFPSSTISFKGNDYKYKELKSIDAKYGVQICFESITTHVLKEMKKEGLPNIILNPTNESSFINFGEPQLALALSSFRAVESRRPMIRSALTGISAYINTKGEIIEPTSMDKKEIKNYKIIIPF